MPDNATPHRAALRLRIKLQWWSFRNWRRGLRWAPIGACRYCDHTTPFHYRTCRKHPRARRLAAGSYIMVNGEHVDLPMEDE